MQSNEILTVVDSVSTEKGLDKEVIFSAIESAIASASQRHFHEDAELYVLIDRSSGVIQLIEIGMSSTKIMKSFILKLIYLKKILLLKLEKSSPSKKIISYLEESRHKQQDK